MTDRISKEQRKRNMSLIKTKGTKIELKVRKILHSMGFRFQCNRKDLVGKPDIVLPKYRVVVQVNGCFWHCHGCNISNIPKTNRLFWKKKLYENKYRDKKNNKLLEKKGWNVVIFWECDLNKHKNSIGNFIYDKLASEGKIEFE